MITSPTTTSNDHTHTDKLCPNCGNLALRILTSATVHYEVVIDTQTKDLVVVNEAISDTDWDGESKVECPVCEWQGHLKDCLNE